MSKKASIEVITYTQVLEHLGSEKHAHVLLGNGFSRACRNDVFAYGSLFEKASFERLSLNARHAFEVLATTDFESVMRDLKHASALVELYAGRKTKLAGQMERDADGLRDLLAETIAQNHPESPQCIKEDRYRACRAFLSRFERIYTLNYDLLLYWALMHNDVDNLSLAPDDGFRTPEEGPEDYVTWDPSNSYSQTVYFLHGALHLFDAGSEIRKYTWCNTGVKLIDQIKDALHNGLYPLIVAEGAADAKLDAIMHSAFLSRCHRSFAQISGALVVFGVSMSKNDEHLLELIGDGKTRKIFVGLHGDPSTKTNHDIVLQTHWLAKQRRYKSLEAYFFDASTVEIWGR